MPHLVKSDLHCCPKWLTWSYMKEALASPAVRRHPGRVFTNLGLHTLYSVTTLLYHLFTLNFI